MSECVERNLARAQGSNGQPAIPHSLPDLVSALRSGELAPQRYLEHLERRFEACEPTIHAFMPEAGRFERLYREAEALLVRYPQRDDRPPLFGVPVGVKDIINVEGMETRAGSRLPAHEFQGPEAGAVAALKRAGALIMGKTVSTEFAYFGPGPTRNPYDPEHTPGGSSSGSAAAVAAGLVPLALGTQTIGSIVRPAAFCGVVGFKASYDRVSKAGVVPLAPSLDHVGTFTLNVPGARVAASLLCADWRADVPQRRPVLAVPEGPYLERASAEALEHFRRTGRRLAEAGYQVLSVPAMPDFDAIVARHNLIVAAEAARVHSTWYDRYRDLYHPKTVELVERGRGVSEAAVAQALTGREQLRVELTQLMDQHGVDLWLAPSAPGPAPRGLESTGDPVMNLPWTHSGLPAVNVPAGLAANGLPLGLQLVGRWQADELLLAWAAEIEQAAHPRHGA